MVASTKSPNIILMLIHNGTNTDFTFDLSNFEVIDKDGQETLADPEFRNYTLQVPHGKYANVLVKMEGNLKQSEDRKSTRLNSSHVSISYAVFCLKKKTKNIIEHEQYL